MIIHTQAGRLTELDPGDALASTWIKKSGRPLCEILGTDALSLCLEAPNPVVRRLRIRLAVSPVCRAARGQ